jgi:hypothetical protein
VRQGGGEVAQHRVAHISPEHEAADITKDWGLRTGANS